MRAISPIKAVAGDSFTMHCPFSGYPIEQISWQKSGQELTSSKLIDIYALLFYVFPMPIDSNKLDAIF